MASLFRTVTRYRPSPGHTPRENTLTQATQVVARRVPALAHALAAQCADAARRRTGDDRVLAALRGLGAGATVRVTTQYATHGRDFVDLQLRFAGRHPGEDVLVWVEVKHGSPLTGDQLRHYVRDIRHEGVSSDRCLVALLAPRQSMPPTTAVPRDVPCVTWQEVAHTVHDLAGDDGLTAPERWLLDEYASYLAEENLMDGDALTARDAFVLSAEPAASASAAAVIEYAHTYVAERWGPAETTKPFGLGFYATHYIARSPDATPAAHWQDAWLDWGLYRDSELRAEPRNGWVFYAGATLRPRGVAVLQTLSDDGWRADLERAGFEVFRQRVRRFLYPEQLLAAGERLDEQGDELGSWVVGSFATLADAPPPDAARAVASP